MLKFTWNREVTLADAVSIFMSSTVLVGLLVGGTWAAAEFKNEQENTKERMVVVEEKVEENTAKIEDVETRVLRKIEQNHRENTKTSEARRVEAQSQRQHIIDMVQTLQSAMMEELRDE